MIATKKETLTPNVKFSTNEVFIHSSRHCMGAVVRQCQTTLSSSHRSVTEIYSAEDDEDDYYDIYDTLIWWWWWWWWWRRWWWQCRWQCGEVDANDDDDARELPLLHIDLSPRYIQVGPPTKPIYNSKYARTMLLHHISLAKK